MPMPVFSPFRTMTFPVGIDGALAVTTVNAIEAALDTCGWIHELKRQKSFKIHLAFHIEGLLDRVTRKVVN